MPRPTQWHVYALEEPPTGEVRYVGWTSDPDKRLRIHIASGRRPKPQTHRACWIKSLLVRGLTPTMRILESGYGDPSPTEISWIRKMRQAGARLTNATDGGEGAVGYRFSAEGCRKLSESHRGYVMPQEQREKIRAAQKKRPMTPARLQALRKFAARMRSRITADSIAKMAESKRGKTQSPELIRKRTEWRIGKKLPEDVKQRMKEAARRRCSTAEGLAQARRAAARCRKAVRDFKFKNQLCLFSGD